MKIGVQLNPQVSIDKPAASLMPTLIEQVRVADQSGFHAFSMGEHYNIPGLQRVHQIPALARLCAEVKHCAVGTAVMLLGLRHPVTVANELATLDVLNNGRSFAAFGLGYRDDELNAFHLTKAQRFHRFVEGIEIIKKLWTEDHVSFAGKEFQIKDVTVDPKPLQKPRPPIWIAANSDTAVERAAKVGDDWIIGPHSAIEELERQVSLFRKDPGVRGKKRRARVADHSRNLRRKDAARGGGKSAPLPGATLPFDLHQMEAERGDERSGRIELGLRPFGEESFRSRFSGRMYRPNRRVQRAARDRLHVAPF